MTQIIKTIMARTKLGNKMYVLQGDEMPEQLTLYLKDFGDKINNNLSLPGTEKLAILKRINDMGGQSTLSKVEAILDTYVDPECTDMIGDYAIWIKIQKECDTYNIIRLGCISGMKTHCIPRKRFLMTLSVNAFIS